MEQGWGRAGKATPCSPGRGAPTPRMLAERSRAAVRPFRAFSIRPRSSAPKPATPPSRCNAGRAQCAAAGWAAGQPAHRHSHFLRPHCHHPDEHRPALGHGLGVPDDEGRGDVVCRAVLRRLPQAHVRPIGCLAGCCGGGEGREGRGCTRVHEVAPRRPTRSALPRPFASSATPRLTPPTARLAGSPASTTTASCAASRASPWSDTPAPCPVSKPWAARWGGRWGGGRETGLRVYLGNGCGQGCP